MGYAVRFAYYIAAIIVYKTYAYWLRDAPTSLHIRQMYALPTQFLCVLYLSENNQRLVPLAS